LKLSYLLDQLVGPFEDCLGNSNHHPLIFGQNAWQIVSKIRTSSIYGEKNMFDHFMIFQARELLKSPWMFREDKK
jgi:hypothetical protein